MSEIAKEILICLSAAHFLGDFLFQSNEDAVNKTRLPVLFKHAPIVAATGFLLCGVWDLWQIPLIILITHGLTDYIKARLRKEGAGLFLLDQGVHLAVITAVTILIATTKAIPINKSSTLWIQLLGKGFLEFLILISGLVASIKAGGILIGLILKPFAEELIKEREQKTSGSEPVRKGFESGGKIIGYLERGMIFLFILTGQPGSIGFLIAAKSIFRFGEIKDRENRLEAEFILIGTLISFAYGIFTAYATRFFLDRLC